MQKPNNQKPTCPATGKTAPRRKTTKHPVLSCFMAMGILISAASSVTAQNGYIYLHKKALDESSSVNFMFNVGGGSTAVSPFLLNDNPATLNVGDLGASHGGSSGAYGDGQLWATTVSSEGYSGTYGEEGTIYMRASGSAAWVSTGQTGYRLDGAGYNALVYCTKAGNAYYYTQGGSNSLVYSPANHGSATIRDIAYGGGTTCIITSTGSILRYTGSYASPTDSWTDITPAGAPATFYEIDILPSSQTIYVQEGGGFYGGTSSGLYSMSATGTNYTAITAPSGAASAGHPSLCVGDDGVVYAAFKDASGDDYQWDYDGNSWTKNIQSRSVHRATGGAGHLVWGINDIGFAYSTIFTRMPDGSRAWIDDERVRSSQTGNAIMIPVAAGTYTIAEAAAAGWDLTNITIYDPTNNSGSSLSGKTAMVNVAAGETVHVTFSNQSSAPAVLLNDCNNPYTENFGSGSASFRAPISGLTAYHYRSQAQFNDGYYTMRKNNQGWFVGASFTADRTPDSVDGGNGYFLAVNAAYSKDEFFRNRVTGLIVGKSYTVEFWAADISLAMPIRPNITFGVANIGTSNFLASVNTGNISHSYWRRYWFNFTATTASVDIIIRNNSVGGNGNDIAIDDISFNITSPAVDAISGNYNVCSNTGSSTTYTNTTSGGVWSVSPASVASINSVTGELTPVANASGTATVYYFVKFPSGCVSTVSKEINITSSCGSGTINISGNVYYDRQGMRDNTVNGDGFPFNNTLYAVAYNNTTGTVQAVANITWGGYGFNNLIAGNDYSVYVTSTLAVVGQTVKPVVTLPLSWVNTGETVGNEAGNDGLANGILSLGVVPVSTSRVNFGVEKKPTANAVSVSGLWNPYGNNRVAVPTLTGTDPEDGTYTGNSGTNTIRIQTLPDPTKGVLYYNGTPVAAGQVIASYTPSLLTVDPDDAAVSPSFLYSQIDSAGIAGDTALVVVGFAMILPVEFTGVSATTENCQAAVRFTTRGEQNISRFELLWSTDGSHWAVTATTPPKGNGQAAATSYKLVHPGAVKGNNFYRIRETDNDGRLAYSETVKLLLNCEVPTAISIYPNPVKDIVYISGLKTGQLLQVLQPDGKLVLKQTATADIVPVQLGNQAAGLYIVQVCNAAGEVISRTKLVKE